MGHQGWSNLLYFEEFSINLPHQSEIEHFVHQLFGIFSLRFVMRFNEGHEDTVDLFHPLDGQLLMIYLHFHYSNRESCLQDDIELEEQQFEMLNLELQNVLI